MFPKGATKDMTEGAPPVSIIILPSGEINPVLAIPSIWEILPALGPYFDSEL
jgi:hypothetical protein